MLVPSADWSRCRYGTFFTLCLAVYVIVMIFTLGRYFQESVSAMQVKGSIETVDNSELANYTANGVKPSEPKLPEGVKTNVNIPQESRTMKISPKTSKNDKAVKESVSVMQVKGSIETVDNSELANYRANGVKPSEPKLQESVKINVNIPQESRTMKISPKTSKNNKAAKEPKAGSSVRKVIILTYMRHGSSLTGDLIQQHPDVFYVYEPLQQTERSYLKRVPVIYLDGRVETNINPEEYWTPDSMSIRILQFIGNCQFQLLDLGTLLQYHMNSSESTRPFRKCQKEKRNVKKMLAVEALKSCMSTVRDPCENASVIAIKVIRLRMIQMEQMLIRDPDIKVIHLLRDPRGSLKSQSEMGLFKWQNLDEAVQSHCRRITDDLAYSKALHRRFPQRILMIRYEEIAEYPQAATEYLYNFIGGLKLTDNIRKYVWKITSAGNPPDCNVICTTRSNSKETAYKWRERMSYDDAKVIQDTCSQMFHIAGYRPFYNQEDLVNRNITPCLEEFGEGYNVMSHSGVQKIANKQIK